MLVSRFGGERKLIRRPCSVALRPLFRSPRVDVERVDIGLHEPADRGEHHAMTLDGGLAAEGFRHQSHPEVPALARTGMPGVLRAVVEDLKAQRGELFFEGRADAADALGSHVRPKWEGSRAAACA